MFWTIFQNLVFFSKTLASNYFSCWSVRNVKFINESFYNTRCLVLFITAVCLIFSFYSCSFKLQDVNVLGNSCFFPSKPLLYLVICRKTVILKALCSFVIISYFAYSQSLSNGYYVLMETKEINLSKPD